MKPAAVLTLSLLVALMLACSWAEVRNFGDQASQAATTVAEDVGPLSSTSSSLVQTAVAGGQTQGPPLLTKVAGAMTQVVSFSEPVTGSEQFGLPHEHFRLITGCAYASYNCLKAAPHTGSDSRPDDEVSADQAVPILATGPGKVARIQFMAQGCSQEQGDCGYGNTVFLDHTLLDGSHIYSLYGHLDTINADLQVGQCVEKGQQLGMMGRSGDGNREYWPNRHLHLEFKTAPVLGDPVSAQEFPGQMPEGRFFGYMVYAQDPNPDDWGYRSPFSFINELQARVCKN